MYRTALYCTAVVLLAAPNRQPPEHIHYTFSATYFVMNHFINIIFVTVFYRVTIKEIDTFNVIKTVSVVDTQFA
jgi:hypothetical protein